MKKRLSERPASVERRDWGESSSDGVRPSRRGVTGAAANLPKLWATVYAGNLPYDISSDSLKFFIEQQVKESGSIAGVRIATDETTGKSRGFAHIDFFEMSVAEKVVKELSGMSFMGRAVKLDLEKSKKRV